MKLRELMEGIQLRKENADLDLEISGVCYDSRKVTPGCVFVAISGYAVDGNRFIPMALEKGAAVVVTDRAPDGRVPYLLVDSSRAALAAMGVNWYGHPAEKMTMVGVTGTNGKTSVTMLLKQVLERCLGAKVGLVGTIQNMIGDEVLYTERTTPESFELQGLFAKMVEAGCTYAVMEVSSHAIALDRVGGVRYEVGVFTNLTEDHLDFHKTMENYAETKAKLFRRCKIGIFNGDDPWYNTMISGADCRIYTTGEHCEWADLRAGDVSLGSDHVSFTAVTARESCPVRLGIPGRFTVYNALSVLGAAVNLGISLRDAAAALGKAQGVKGRIEVVPTPGEEFTVLIDYAHTPDGLENVLRSVQDFCKGRVIAVFGCGGDRDPIKRPIMGKIGVENSDLAVITSDNPRTEDPDKIIEDILVGVAGTETPYVVIENRRQAIAWALDHGKKDDIIVLAGKGHETYQEIGRERVHLDEREEVARWLEGRKEKKEG